VIDVADPIVADHDGSLKVHHSTGHGLGWFDANGR